MRISDWSSDVCSSDLTIHGTPPFAPAEPTRLSFRRLNYLFGTNGVGKTAISRIIADPGAYPACSLTWSNGTPLQTLVLHRDFVDRSLRTLGGIKPEKRRVGKACVRTVNSRGLR